MMAILMNLILALLYLPFKPQESVHCWTFSRLLCSAVLTKPCNAQCNTNPSVHPTWGWRHTDQGRKSSLVWEDEVHYVRRTKLHQTPLSSVARSIGHFSRSLEADEPGAVWHAMSDVHVSCFANADVNVRQWFRHSAETLTRIMGILRIAAQYCSCIESQLFAAVFRKKSRRVTHAHSAK